MSRTSDLTSDLRQPLRRRVNSGSETAVERASLGDRWFRCPLALAHVGVQVGQLAGLDPAALQAGVEVLPPYPDREPQGGKPAVTDHLVDRVDVEVEVPGRRIRIHPLVAVRHRSRSVAKPPPRRLGRGELVPAAA